MTFSWIDAVRYKADPFKGVSPMIRNFIFPFFFSVLMSFSLSLKAAETSVVFTMDGDEVASDYSSAILVSARALKDNGDPLTNARLYFYVTPVQEDSDGGMSPTGELVEIDNALTDSTGTATTRLVLVNGIYEGLEFVASNPTATQSGEPYQIVAKFQGDVDNEMIYTDAGPQVISTVYAPSENSFPLYLSTEMTRIEIAAGNRVALGESLQLIATLTDPNGDASESGQQTDGPGPKELVNKKVSFYYDSNGDGQAQVGERLGSNQTNNAGQATWDFEADPEFVKAGNFTQGLHVQFGGDDKYKLAASIAELVIEAGEPDPNLTLMSSDITPMVADGRSEAVISITLVDRFNNPLGVDAPDYTVEVSATLGTLGNAVERDPVSGLYTQTLLAPLEGEEIVVTAEVVGFAGQTTLTIPLLPAEGCNCSQSQTPAPWNASGGLFALVMLFGISLRNKKRRK
tara:strand:+ start:1218 stop:2594 length:1377 start_codon:yes stop_codon:yes gene_type:complete